MNQHFLNGDRINEDSNKCEVIKHAGSHLRVGDNICLRLETELNTDFISTLGER